MADHPKDHIIEKKPKPKPRVKKLGGKKK